MGLIERFLLFNGIFWGVRYIRAHLPLEKVQGTSQGYVYPSRRGWVLHCPPVCSRTTLVMTEERE